MDTGDCSTDNTAPTARLFNQRPEKRKINFFEYGKRGHIAQKYRFINRGKANLALNIKSDQYGPMKAATMQFSSATGISSQLIHSFFVYYNV